MFRQFKRLMILSVCLGSYFVIQSLGFAFLNGQQKPTLKPNPILTKNQGPSELHLDRQLLAQKQNFREIASNSTALETSPIILTIENIKHRIQKDLLCSSDGSFYLKNQFFENPLQRSPMIFEALLQASEITIANKYCLLAMIEKDPDEALKHSLMSNEPACRLLQALFLTDQFFPSGNDKNIDYQKGLAILDQLKHEHPNNGIFPFFKIGAYSSQRQFEDLEQEIMDLLATTKFDNPLQPAIIELQSLGQTNTTALVLASEVLSAHGVPDYQKASEAMQMWISEEKNPLAQATDQTKAWLDVQFQKLQDIQIKALTEPFVSLLEMALIRSFGKTFYQKWMPEAELPSPLKDEEWIPLFRHTTGLNDGPLVESNFDGENCSKIYSEISKNSANYWLQFLNRKQIYESSTKPSL